MVPQAEQQVKRQCCCNSSGGGGPDDLTKCECCPIPYEGFNEPAWELTFNHGGPRNCATGSGSIGGGGPCLCGTCGLQYLDDMQCRELTTDFGAPTACSVPNPWCPAQQACDDCEPGSGDAGGAQGGGKAVFRVYGCKYGTRRMPAWRVSGRR